ncbi:MAG: DUF6675 family protein [Spirochaetaceae bacterium]|nr:hypothetical protein [Spirochaetaceae bacterium]MDT8298138.1 DUF6675 family protein [Spirochaetaceae bacterium]
MHPSNYPVQRRRFITDIASIAILALSLFTLPPAGALSLDDALPSMSASDRASLINEGELLRFHPDGVSPGLLPNTELTADVVRRIVAGDLNIGIEGLFFTPIDSLPSSYSTMDSDERKLALYNILLSVSTLEGLEYYSASRGEMRLLFEESWVIADPDNKEPLPDRLAVSVPAQESIFIHQKDKSFGSNESVMTFRAASDVFATDIINLTPMRYKGIIKVVDPENMQVHLIVVPVDEGLLLYGTMSAQTRNVKAFLDRARNSFTNRVVALTGWYKDRLLDEFGG